MCLIFVGQGYPRKLFNLEHFPIYGNTFQMSAYIRMKVKVYVLSNGVLT